MGGKRNDPNRTDLLVVGRSAVGIFAAATGALYAKRSLLVGSTRQGLLSPIRDFFPEIQLTNTMVPIFPPDERTHLSEILSALGVPIETIGGPDHVGERMIREYKFDDGTPIDRTRPPTEGSFAAYASGRGSRTEILSRKQYGDHVVDSMRLRLVREKTERSYGGKAGSGNVRMAYVAGQSRYALAAHALAPRLHAIDDTVVGIDTQARAMTLSSGSVIKYEMAVFTGHLQSLASLLNLPSYKPRAAPAHFCVCLCQSGTPSKVVYDLRPDSPILRVVSTDERILIVQLSQAANNEFHGSLLSEPYYAFSIEKAVETLCDGLRPQVISGVCTISQAYPLEPLESHFEEELAARCNQAGIKRFGRFAEWRYIDLHELDWLALRGTYDAS